MGRQRRKLTSAGRRIIGNRAIRSVVETLERRQLLAGTDPFISEFMPDNVTTAIRDDFGNREDWIEIYNPGPTVNLLGWKLKDSSKTWTFPSVTLGPGQYIRVWASDRNRTSDPLNLHTNFKLSPGGEYLALLKPDGTPTTEFNPYPAVPQDMSYGFGPAFTENVTAIYAGLPARYHVPTSNVLGTTWTGQYFDDTAADWNDAILGVGYEKAGNPLPMEAEPNNTVATANVAMYNFQPYSGNLYHMGIRGTALGTDFFKIGDLQAGDVLTVTVSGSASRVTTYASDPGVRLYRAGNQSTALTTDSLVQDAGPGTDSLIARYTITTNDVYYVQVYRPGGTSNPYDLGLWLENSGPAPLTGENWTQEVESNSTFATANDISKSWRPVQYRSQTTGTITTGDVDHFWHQFKQGDLVTIVIDSTSSLDARVSLIGTDGTTVLAREDGTSEFASPYDKDSPIYAFQIPADGIYTVKVEAASGTGTYIANVYLSSNTAPPTGGGWGTYGGQINAGGNIGPAMYGVNPGAYIRVEFLGPDPANLTSLQLRMNYDDGFIAYLNGVEVARANVGGGSGYATMAGGSHQAGTFESFDILPHKGAIRPEEYNILAIHLLNQSAGDTDALAVPELKYTAVIPGSAQYFATPTPAAANVPGTLGKVADTKFSVNRGFFDAPFDVAITTSTSGATIRYTTDGSVPTATTGNVYTGPIRISGTTMLRAAAFKSGWTSTDVDTQTYIFLDQVIAQTGAGFPDTWGYTGQSIKTPPGPDYAMDSRITSAYAASIRNDLRSLPVVSVVMNMEDLFGANGIYPKFGVGEKPMSAEFFTANGAEQWQINGGIQVGGEGIGGTSGDRWKTYKLSLRLKFKSVYGEPKLEYKVYGDGGPREFDTLILDAQINHTWLHPDSGQQSTAKFIQDQYIADLQSAMSGQNGPRGRFVHLYLNGLYWGVYDLHERPDEDFAEYYYGGAKEDYDVIKHGIQYGAEAVVNGTSNTYQELLNRVRMDMTVTANYQAVEQMLDIDDFIDYMLANFYGGNDDWAHKNWYATYNRVDPNGRWRFHSWDAEHTLKNVSVNVTGDNDTGGPTEIHTRLKVNPEYRLRFADRMQKHFFNGGALTVQRTTAMYQARMNEVYAAMVAESARWGDNRRPSLPYTREDWLATQNGLLANYFPYRSGNVFNQLASGGLFPSISAPAFSVRGGTFAGPTALDLANPNATGVIYYTLDGTDPRVAYSGAVRATAMLYTGQIEVTDSAWVRARVYNPATATWSALDEVAFVIGPPPPLRVTEIMYNPAGPQGANSPYMAEDYEFIELMNTGSTKLKLGGYAFTRGISFTFPADAELDAGGRLVLVKNAAAFQERYGTGIPVAGVYGGSLSDSGESITLVSHVGQLVQDFQYQSWFGSATDGGGFSIMIGNPYGDPTSWNLKESWRVNNRQHGTPSAADFGYAPGSVVISEVLAHTDLGAGDWIELHNTTPDPINISGWFLSDSALKLDKYVIQNTTLPGFGYAYFTFAGHFGNPSDAGFRESFAFSELGEEAYLTSNDGLGIGGYRERVDFGASDREVSFIRHVKSTGTTDFVASAQNTPGQPNSAPRVGPVVINEINYAPAMDKHEYVELRNISGAAVPLYDPVNPSNIWKFTNGITFAFPTGSVLGAGAYALVVPIDPALFRSTYGIPAAVQIFGPYSGALDNAGEKLELSRPGDPEAGTGLVPYIAVDRVNYQPKAPWPTLAPGESLAKKPSNSYGNDPANWLAGGANGTPGAANYDEDTTAPTAQIAPVSPNPRNTPVSQVTIVFSEAVVGLDVGDLVLSRNGGANLLTAAQTLTSGDGGLTWVLGNLGSLTGAEGDYVLMLTAVGTGIMDLAGNALAAGSETGFTVDTTLPTATVTIEGAGGLRNTPIERYFIEFSEPVTGFGMEDLTLKRDGGANLLPGGATLAQTGPRSWTLSGLAGITNVSGQYVLTVRGIGAGIRDGAGNLMILSASLASTVDTIAPIATISPPTTPRTAGITELTISFSEVVGGVDADDFVVKRDGVVVPLSGQATLSTNDNMLWTLSGLYDLTFVEGIYTVEVAATGSGITDLAGNAPAASAVATFTVTATTIQATDSLAWTLRRSGTDVLVLRDDVVRYTLAYDRISSLVFSSTAAGASLTVDQRDGQVIPVGGIEIAGAPGLRNSLAIIGSGSQAATVRGPEGGRSQVSIGPKILGLTNVDDLALDGFASVNLVTPQSSDTLTVSSPAAGTTRVTGTSGMASLIPMNLANTAALVLDIGAGDSASGVDLVTINGLAVSSLSIHGGLGPDTIWLNSSQPLNSTLVLNSVYEVNIGASARLASLDVAAGGRASIAGPAGAVLTVDRLAIGAGGTLDLKESELVIRATAQTAGDVMAQVHDWIGSARNAGGGGLWSGTGITTSLAGAHTGLGSLLKAVDSTIHVKLATNGDTDLNGRLNADDYFRLDKGLFAGGTGQGSAGRWAMGDFNYDTRIDIDDAILIDSAFMAQAGAGGGQSNVTATALVARSAQAAPLAAAEPADAAQASLPQNPPRPIAARMRTTEAPDTTAKKKTEVSQSHTAIRSLLHETIRRQARKARR